MPCHAMPCHATPRHAIHACMHALPRSQQRRRRRQAAGTLQDGGRRSCKRKDGPAPPGCPDPRSSHDIRAAAGRLPSCGSGSFGCNPSTCARWGRRRPEAWSPRDTHSMGHGGSEEPCEQAGPGAMWAYISVLLPSWQLLPLYCACTNLRSCLLTLRTLGNHSQRWGPCSRQQAAASMSGHQWGGAARSLLLVLVLFHSLQSLPSCIASPAVPGEGGGEPASPASGPPLALAQARSPALQASTTDEEGQLTCQGWPAMALRSGPPPLQAPEGAAGDHPPHAPRLPLPPCSLCAAGPTTRAAAGRRLHQTKYNIPPQRKVG